MHHGRALKAGDVVAMRNGVTVKDRGWNRIKREFTKANGSGVKIGVQADVKPRKDPTEDMLAIAVINEFGSGRVPERSFIRASFDKYGSSLDSYKTRLMAQVTAGKLSMKKALGWLGKLHQGQIQGYIKDLDTPPNAPSTIARKGADNPLIDTGQLRRSIDFKVVMK